MVTRSKEEFLFLRLSCSRRVCHPIFTFSYQLQTRSLGFERQELQGQETEEDNIFLPLICCLYMAILLLAKEDKGSRNITLARKTLWADFVIPFLLDNS